MYMNMKKADYAIHLGAVNQDGLFLVYKILH